LAAQAQVPESHSAATGRVVAVLSALLSFALSLVFYYLAVGFVAVFSIAGGLGAPASVDPPGFQVLMMAIIYGGPVWALAVATATYRAVRQSTARPPWTWVGDALIVVGAGLMTAVFGLWPSLLAPEHEMSSTALVGAVSGFAVGAGLTALFIVVR